uniref:ABC transporter domain-containing protein n=1 Tax=Bionectria ochroleuca TaxID=29856 RepID=A0A8H7K1N0_BIOOC
MAYSDSAGELFEDAFAKCHGELDLSLFATWVSIGVAGAFGVLSLIQLGYLMRRPTIVRAPALLLVSKLIFGIAWAAFTISLLVLAVTDSSGPSKCSSAQSILNVISACQAVILSLCAHFKSRRPSTLLCSFLFVSLLTSVAKCQLLWMVATETRTMIISALFTASTAMQMCFLGTNSKWRPDWLSWDTDAHSPEETSSIFSLGLYSWLNSLLWKGYRNVLSLDDLYPLDQAIAAGIPEKATNQILQSTKRQSNWAVLMWAAKPLARPLLLPIFPRICLIGFTFCQPFLINRLLEYLAQDGEESSEHDAAGLVGATILVYLGIAISTSLYWYYQERSQSLLRAFLVTSIYQKATQAPSSENKAAITLMSTDVDRIYTGVRFVHEIWANIIQIALSAWHLYRVIGLSFLAPLILVAFAFATSIVLSKYATKYQRNWMKFVERRIGVTSYALSHIKEYRISGMTSPVQNLVQDERVEEIRQGGKSRGIIGISATTSYIPQALAPVLTFAFGSKVIDSTKAFTTLSFLSLLASPLMLVLQVIPILSACFACLRRIHEFTLTPNRQDPRLAKGQLVTSLDENSSRKETSLDAAVILSGTSFGWVAETPVLKDIHVSIERSSLTFVIGTVASGKSTLCKGILGEVPFCTGQIMVDAAADKIGYCDQSPFLMNATVVENIIGNTSFDSRRYNDVISATMLKEDLKTFSQKDQTKIGSKGVSLSGGQRQRISLARALYHDAELLILDDIFTGLDEKTSQQICWRVFGPDGLLRSRRTTVVLCTQATQFMFVADQIVELSSDGTVSKQGVAENFISETVYPQNYEVLSLGQKKEDTDDVLQVSPLEEHSTTLKDTPTVNMTANPALKTDTSLIFPLHVIDRLAFGFFFNFPAIWLKIWSADSVKKISNYSFAFYIGIFVLVAVLGVFVVFAMGLINLQTFVRLSGTHLHEQVLQTAMHSSLRFLTTTDTGKILNLFSQDMTIIDSQLPRMVNNFLNTLASSLGQAIIVALSSGYLAISYPFFILILFGLQKVYLPTSKQLRILDLDAKSPLFTHFLDTQDGIATLRAFGWIPDQISRNKALLNSSQRPSYLLAMAQQWLLLVMNIIVAILAIILVSLATNLQDINSGSVGAGLVMLMGLGASMTAVINSYTGLEIALDAVPAVEWPPNGVIAISDVAASYTSDPNALVLSEVALDVKSGDKVAVCGRTGSGKSSLISLILRMIDPLTPHGRQLPSMVIDGTHLGNINRTALRERIIALSQDAVFLPEGSSFRSNLDPWNDASREEAMDALAVVGLLDMLQDRGGLDALVKNAELSAGQKQIFALGRAILRRRVRARKMSEKGLPEGGVLLLDEVTASVDKETERQMLELVWREFEAYTILMVTHSIQAAVRCDRVVIMEKGKIVEDDESGALMQDEASRFRALAGSLADN